MTLIYKFCGQSWIQNYKKARIVEKILRRTRIWRKRQCHNGIWDRVIISEIRIGKRKHEERANQMDQRQKCDIYNYNKSTGEKLSFCRN